MGPQALDGREGAVTDRITGILLLLLAIAYGVSGSHLEAAFVTDPLGPSAFPVMLATLLGIFSLYLLFRPDPNPEWHGWTAWRRQLLALAGLILYGAILEYIGFLISSAILVAYLSFLMGAKGWRLGAIGVCASVGLYFLFNDFLGLPLPAGEIFGG